MSYNIHFSPSAICSPPAYLLQRVLKNIHKQREYGMNPVLLTDHIALQGENQIVKPNYFLSLLRERLSSSDFFPFTVFEKLNYLKAGIKLVITQYFRS